MTDANSSDESAQPCEKAIIETLSDDEPTGGQDAESQPPAVAVPHDDKQSPAKVRAHFFFGGNCLHLFTSTEEAQRPIQSELSQTVSRRCGSFVCFEIEVTWTCQGRYECWGLVHVKTRTSTIWAHFGQFFLSSNLVNSDSIFPFGRPDRWFAYWRRLTLRVHPHGSNSNFLGGTYANTLSASWLELVPSDLKSLDQRPLGRHHCHKMDAKDLAVMMVHGTNSESVRKRGLVVDFLEELYNCVSEPMPEANQTVDEAGLHPGDKSLYVMPQMKFRRNRGKMPGKKFREKQLKPLRGQPVRLLPPGSFTEYLGLLKAKFPQEKFSLKLMCPAPRLSTLILMFSPVIISTCSIYLYYVLVVNADWLSITAVIRQKINLLINEGMPSSNFNEMIKEYKQ